MNDILSISRLFLLIKNHLVENRMAYMLYAIGMLAIGLISYIFIFAANSFQADYYHQVEGVIIDPDDTTEWETIQFVLYFAGLYIFGGIFACISFVNFSNSAEAIFYLNKPASHLEKWLTEIIIRVVLLFFVYTILFYIVDIPATFIARAREYADHLTRIDVIEDPTVVSPDNEKQIFHASKIFSFSMPNIGGGIIYGLLWSGYLCVIGFFMYGAVLFNRFSFFKTLFLAFIIGMIYFFYGLIVISSDSLMPGEWRYSFPGGAYLSGPVTEVYDPNTGFRTSLDDGFINGVTYVLLLIVPAVLLACSYFKLKEKEV